MRQATLSHGRLQFVSSTGSTNADLLASVRGAAPVPEGQWLIADRQTAGRGRQGRGWEDGRGNFMGSTVIRLAPGDPAPASLALVSGLALYETVRTLLSGPVQLQLKWPNDLMIDGAKLAGILLERAGDCVVAGFGVNLAHAPKVAGRQTAALTRYGPAPDRDLFAATLADSLAEELARWRTYGVEPVIRRWQTAAHPVGTRLTVLPPGELQLAGEFAGLAEDGSLRLALPNGETRIIRAGDVMLNRES